MRWEGPGWFCLEIAEAKLLLSEMGKIKLLLSEWEGPGGYCLSGRIQVATVWDGRGQVDSA